MWEFLVDPEKVARWKGLPAMTFDPTPGGAFRIEIVPGNIASGEFVELDRPRRLVYTWGWEPDADGPNVVPPGSSTVEIELVPEDGGTKLLFTHRDLPTAKSAESPRRRLGPLPRAPRDRGGRRRSGPDPWLGGAA